MFSLHQEGASAVFSLDASALMGQSFAITHTCHMLGLDPHISTQWCCQHNMKPHSNSFRFGLWLTEKILFENII